VSVSPHVAGGSWRFRQFAGVGAAGFALQLAVVFALTAVGVNYLIATGLAVELAIVHNFVWHELYTWRDARATSAAVVARRLLLFNASTAVVSIGGNVVLTVLLVGSLHVVPAVANALAVMVLSLANYTVASRLVFPATVGSRYASVSRVRKVARICDEMDYSVAPDDDRGRRL
jgi:dolichol-phosphate mannosyltransferase